MDAHVEEIALIFFNGTFVNPQDIFDDQRIYLPLSLQKQGENHIKIIYRTPYASYGGLHILHDYKNNRSYTYTKFEPFFAHKMFPCFDQPDMKAKMKLITFTPSDWVVITNEIEETLSIFGEGDSLALLQHYDIDPILAEGFKGRAFIHIFPETKRISTYLYAIAAGNYEIFADEYVPGEPPLRIITTPDIHEEVMVQSLILFYLTRLSIKFLEEYLHCKYPFSKYDQVFVPGYQWYAMENVACVIYDQSVILDVYSTSRTSVHELSHHWFGDCVTTKWWNDLWLNESFATFLSPECRENASGLDAYRGSWFEFYQTKSSTYSSDSFYAVAREINLLKESQRVYDQVIYYKGASILKQLKYIMGEESFRNALGLFLDKFKFSAANIEDFFKIMQEVYDSKNYEQKLNLIKWGQDWLQTTGNNTLYPEFEVENDKIKKFVIHQEKKLESDIYRIHCLKIALYTTEGGLILEEKVFVNDSPTTPIPQLVGKEGIGGVFINYDDMAYARVYLDDKSCLYFQNYAGINLGSDLSALMIADAVNAKTYGAH